MEEEKKVVKAADNVAKTLSEIGKKIELIDEQHPREGLKAVKPEITACQADIGEVQKNISDLKTKLTQKNIAEKDKQDLEEKMKKETKVLADLRKELKTYTDKLKELEKRVPERDQKEITEVSKTMSALVNDMTDNVKELYEDAVALDLKGTTEIDSTKLETDVNKVLEKMKAMKTMSGTGSALGRYLALTVGWDGKGSSNKFTRLLGKLFMKYGWSGTKKIKVLATRFASRKMGTATFLSKLSANIKAAESKGVDSFGTTTAVERGLQNVWKVYRDWCILSFNKLKVTLGGRQITADDLPESLRFWGVDDKKNTRVLGLEKEYKLWKKELKSNLKYDGKKLRNLDFDDKDIEDAYDSIIKTKNEAEKNMASALRTGGAKQGKINEKEAKGIEKK